MPPTSASSSNASAPANKPLHDCKIALSGYLLFRGVNILHSEAMEKLTALGAEATLLHRSHRTTKITHVIASSTACANHRVRQLQLGGAFIVPIEWLIDCEQQNTRIPETKYAWYYALHSQNPTATGVSLASSSSHAAGASLANSSSHTAPATASNALRGCRVCIIGRFGSTSARRLVDGLGGVAVGTAWSYAPPTHCIAGITGLNSDAVRMARQQSIPVVQLD